MRNGEVISMPALREMLTQLVGKSAWKSRAGSGTGSIFTLEFGSAWRDDSGRGEFSFMVYCAWRITQGSQILLSWHDNSDGVIAPGLEALEGLVVSGTELSEYADLTIRFENGRELQIIQDFSPFYKIGVSWFVVHKRIAYKLNFNNSISADAFSS